MTGPEAPRPAAVVFDLGGVVFRYRPERRLQRLAAATGLPADEVRKRLMGSGFSRSCDAGRLDADGAHREAVRLLGGRLGFERFRDLWLTAFEPDPAVVALVRRLKSRAVPMAMLSNNSVLVRGGLEHRHPRVLELFRPRLFSADAGLLKPDPRLFRTLLTLLAVSPAEVLYVDDDRVHVDAAAALGMQAWPFSGTPDLEARLGAVGLLT